MDSTLNRGGDELVGGGMMSSRRNPFDELERMFERMSRQFDRAAQDFGSELQPLVRDTIRVDLEDRDDAFVLWADLPGFDKDDIDIQVMGDMVSIEADQTASTEVETGTYLRRERQQHSVSRSIPLPESVEEDDASAEFENGVLTVTLPKRERSGGESISIE